MYYKGHLAKTKKQFDACLNGTPFSFRLGAGEVIRGWDLGVAGKYLKPWHHHASSPYRAP